MRAKATPRPFEAAARSIIRSLFVICRNIEQSDGERLLSTREVSKRVGVHSTTIRRRVARREFPKPLKVGKHRAWIEADVMRWLEQNA